MTSLRPYVSAGYSFDEDTEIKGGADLLYQDFGLNLPSDSEIFIDNLPGFPDGISSNGGGVYWLALVSPRNALIDQLEQYITG